MLRRVFPEVYEGWIVVWSFALLIVVIGTVFFFGFGTLSHTVGRSTHGRT